jgi:hypothetical protein
MATLFNISLFPHVYILSSVTLYVSYHKLGVPQRMLRQCATESAECVETNIELLCICS